MPLVALLLTALAGLVVLLGGVAVTYRDAQTNDLDADTWSGIVALAGGFAYVGFVVQFPLTGSWLPLPAVGCGFLVYLLVRGAGDEESPGRPEAGTLPGSDED